MARTIRVCPAGEVFHVLNRAVARLTICEKPEDYAAFMRVVGETWEIVLLPIYARVAMPNHWHFVVRPETKRAGECVFPSPHSDARHALARSTC
ncbi:hypothetical protein [Schlesneria sp.]|uniref:hypothetical protein n=1 Tax=Schlesneria sp. TaxID=2762018 RepID=UPI002EDD46F4